MLQKRIQSPKVQNSLLYPKLRILLLYALAFFGGSILLILFTSETEVFWSRLLCAATVIFFLLLALLNNVVETNREEHAWRQLANQTGLSCQVLGSVWTGFAVRVSGSYKGRQLKLSTSRRASVQVPATRIEIDVDNISNASMRLRGPFGKKVATSDIVARDLFGATAARQFGGDKRFFVRSQPLHLVTNLLRTEILWEKLSKVEGLINIELEGRTLYFEKFGVLGDADYLNDLFDILSDIADVIETGCKMRALACRADFL